MTSSDDDGVGPSEGPQVKVVTIGPESARKSVSVVARDCRVFCFRHQWVKLWGLDKNRFGRDPESSSDFSAHSEAATKDLCRQQRDLNRPGSTDTKMTLVEVGCLVRHTPGCPPTTVLELQAFALWSGPRPLQRKPPGFDQHTSPEDDDGTEDEEDVAEDVDGHSRRCGLTKQQREEGVVGLHFRALHSFYRSTIDLGRGSRRQLSHITVQNIEQGLSVFMGFEKKTLTETVQIGVLSVLDGDKIWRFYNHLLNVRELRLSSVEQYANWLLGAVDFVLIDVLDQAGEAWAVRYRERVNNLVGELRRWRAKCGEVKPTFRELVERREFVFLPEICKRTEPFIRRAITKFRESPSTRTASAVRNAALLCFTAGDSLNVRPGEVTYLCDADKGGRCLVPGCDRPSCPGNTARALPDGTVELCLVHHKTLAKTGRARLRTFKSETLTAEALR